MGSLHSTIWQSCSRQCHQYSSVISSPQMRRRGGSLHAMHGHGVPHCAMRRRHLNPKAHLRVCGGGVLGAPNVLEVAVLRPDARVVQPATATGCRDEVWVHSQAHACPTVLRWLCCSLGHEQSGMPECCRFTVGLCPIYDDTSIEHAFSVPMVCCCTMVSPLTPPRCCGGRRPGPTRSAAGSWRPPLP